MRRIDLLESSLAYAIDLLEEQAELTDWTDEDADEAVSLYEDIAELRENLRAKGRVYH